MSGFVANELSAYCLEKKAVEGAALSSFLLGERRAVTPVAVNLFESH